MKDRFNALIVPNNEDKMKYTSQGNQLFLSKNAYNEYDNDMEIDNDEYMDAAIDE